MVLDSKENPTPRAGAGGHMSVGASSSAEEHQSVVTGGPWNGAEWLRAQVVQDLAGTRVPDGGAMHWLSDTSQVSVSHLESSTYSGNLCGIVNECMTLWH